MTWDLRLRAMTTPQATCETINHSEEVGELLGGLYRDYEVNMDMVKTTTRQMESLQRCPSVRLNFGYLA